MRMDQGLAASDIVTEFRLLRQEIGRAMRAHLADSAPALIWLRPGVHSQHFYVGHDELL